MADWGRTRGVMRAGCDPESPRACIGVWGKMPKSEGQRGVTGGWKMTRGVETFTKNMDKK